MADINLLSSDFQDTSKINNGLLSRIIAILALVLLVIAVGIYVVLWLVNRSSTKTLVNTKQQTQTLQTEALGNKDRNELVTRQEQLEQLSTLIDKHVYWSYLFPEIARVSLKSAKYTQIKAVSDGNMELDVMLPNYTEVEKFMQIFDLPEYNQQFSNVQIIGIDKIQNGTTIEITLRLRLKFNPNYIKGRL